MEIAVRDRIDIDREIERRFLIDPKFKAAVELASNVGMNDRISAFMTESETHQIFNGLRYACAFSIVLNERLNKE